MLLLLQAAEEAAEPSKTPFYILASCLVAFALILSAIGTVRHETFPATKGAARAIMLAGVLLGGGTMSPAVITAKRAPRRPPATMGGRDLTSPSRGAHVGTEEQSETGGG